LKKFLFAAVKIGVSAAILAWLFVQAWRDESFATLWRQPKNWPLIAAALGVLFAGVSLTFLRWYLLVRALGLPFSLRDAFRLGFLGYLLNFFTLGIVGGDVIKAVFLARQQPGRRTEAVATVVVDRMVGLYALFLLSAISYLAFSVQIADESRAVEMQGVIRVGQAAIALSAAGAVAIGVLLLPGFTTSPWWDVLTGLPRVGPTFERIVGAVRAYRRRVPLMLGIVVMSLGNHVLFAAAVFLVAGGLYPTPPSLGAHMIIVPIANLAGAVPLPGGLGAYELALDFLYRGIAPELVDPRQGFVVALGFRVVAILVAMVGLVYYLAGRKEVRELIEEAERESGPP
jgi:uncharacterized membrane protein YbhN (UPF0104 family)